MSKILRQSVKGFQYDPRRPCQSPCTGQDHRGLLRNTDPLQQVGNITVPEARILMIQPWEKKMIREIEKAIMVSDIGINPTNDGTCIRLVFPELTEDRRKDLAKEVKKKGEGAKVAVRNIRRDANDAFKS